MRILLDTHAFLWFYFDKEKLSMQAGSLTTNANNRLYLSYASVWELSIKIGLGRLELPAPLKYLVEFAERDGISLLPIKLAHLHQAENLPIVPDHRDPFDRLLVSQAIVEGFEILSADHKLDHYYGRRLW